LRSRPGVYIAGQLTGVEGYVESAALGGIAGLNAARAVRGLPLELPDAVTAHGALLGYLRGADPRNFQPMNVNYGLFPGLPQPPQPPQLSQSPNKPVRLRKREKNQKLAERALQALQPFVDSSAALLE
jgi:methylenetetrahydrofolate--tRNA-(uracil-5-)-methyltransferase